MPEEEVITIYESGDYLDLVLYFTLIKGWYGRDAFAYHEPCWCLLEG